MTTTINRKRTCRNFPRALIKILCSWIAFSLFFNALARLLKNLRFMCITAMRLLQFQYRCLLSTQMLTIFCAWKTLDKCIKISSGLDISPNRHHEGSDIQVDSSLPIQFGVCWSLLLCHSYSNSLIQVSLHQVLFQWRILGIKKAQSLVLVRLFVGNNKRINVQILVCKVTYWVGWWSQQNFGCLIYK